MKIALFFVLVFTLLISVSIPQDAFAGTSTLRPVSGSGAPGCEETSSGCYSPGFLIIDEGDSVQFFNSDTAAHTVTSRTGVFDSSLVMSQASWTHKFTNHGMYEYYCLVHPWMTGMITVNTVYVAPDPYVPPTSSYTPPTSSGTDYQQKYFDILSDFNAVSAKVGQLETENQKLVVDGAAYRIQSEGLQTEVTYLETRNANLQSEITVLERTVGSLNSQIAELEQSVKNLNAIVMEQVKVIYDWVVSK